MEEAAGGGRRRDRLRSLYRKVRSTVARYDADSRTWIGITVASVMFSVMMLQYATLKHASAISDLTAIQADVLKLLSKDESGLLSFLDRMFRTQADLDAKQVHALGSLLEMVKRHEAAIAALHAKKPDAAAARREYEAMAAERLRAVEEFGAMMRKAEESRAANSAEVAGIVADGKSRLQTLEGDAQKVKDDARSQISTVTGLAIGAFTLVLGLAGIVGFRIIRPAR